MRQAEIEKLAFFYLCEEKDRIILEKKEKISYKDFVRFDYLTRRLGFWELNKWIWKEFSAEFTEKIEVFSGQGSELESELEEQTRWWKDFAKKKELLDSQGDYC